MRNATSYRTRCSARLRGVMISTAALFGSLAAVALVGCDDPHSALPPTTSPAADVAPQPTSNKPPAPTADQLLHGEQITIPLRAIPFSATAPTGWSITSHAGLMMLEGPTPAGSAQIQLGRHASPIAQHAQRLIEGAKKDVAADPDPLNRVDVRKIGDIQILEYRKVGKSTGTPAIDANGKQIAPTGTRVVWKVTSFVPSNRGGAIMPSGATAKDGDIDVCELSFVDLTREQYELDKELLEKIVASLKYDPTAASN